MTETMEDRETFSIATQEFNQALGDALQRFIQRTGYYVANIHLVPGLNDDGSIHYDLYVQYEHIGKLTEDNKNGKILSNT